MFVLGAGSEGGTGGLSAPEALRPVFCAALLGERLGDENAAEDDSVHKVLLSCRKTSSRLHNTRGSPDHRLPKTPVHRLLRRTCFPSRRLAILMT